MPKMNTSADRDRRQMFGNTRGRDLYWGFTIGVFANLATLFLIIQGGDLPQLAMTAAIVGTFVFVMINSFDCLDERFECSFWHSFQASDFFSDSGLVLKCD